MVVKNSRRWWAYDLIKRLMPHFNERPCDDVDFSFIADHKQIDVCEMLMKKRGYHAHDEGIDYVFIKKTLKGLRWLETAFHELFHAILQVPMKELHDQFQKEVIALSLIALIPLSKMVDFSFLEENPTRHARKLFKEREKVYFFYGV